MGCCCFTSTTPEPDVDADGIEIPGTTNAKKARRLERRSQKVRLNRASDSSGFHEQELNARTKRGVVAGVDFDDDDELGLPSSPQAPLSEYSNGSGCAATAAADAEAAASPVATAAAEVAAAAAAAAAAEEEAARLAAEEEAERLATEAEAARLAAEAEARAKAEEEAAKAKAAAEAQAHAAKLNAALAGRIASSKPKSRAQELHTAAALQMSDTAAFDAFVKWEDEVQRAASSLLGRMPKVSKKPKKTDGNANLLTLLTMEEQTRNASFVSAMQTQTLARPLQGKALRNYGMLCDNVLNKLARRLPSMPREVAPLVSAYLSAVSQHRDLAKAARPDGFVS